MHLELGLVVGAVWAPVWGVVGAWTPLSVLSPSVKYPEQMLLVDLLFMLWASACYLLYYFLISHENKSCVPFSVYSTHLLTDTGLCQVFLLKEVFV